MVSTLGGGSLGEVRSHHPGPAKLDSSLSKATCGNLLDTGVTHSPTRTNWPHVGDNTRFDSSYHSGRSIPSGSSILFEYAGPVHSPKRPQPKGMDLMNTQTW